MTQGKNQQDNPEVLRILNEIAASMKENNTMFRHHIRTVDSIDERVRKIGVNTSSM